MTDDISKVVRDIRYAAGSCYAITPAELDAWADRLESATTPAEVGEVKVLAERLERLSHHHRVRDIEFGQSATDCVSAANTIRTLARQLAEQRDYADKAAQRVISAEIKQKAAESQLAEATRRLGDVEGLLREIRGDYEAGLGVTRESYDTFCRFGAHGTLPNDTWPLHFERRKEQIDAAIDAGSATGEWEGHD